jgi:transcriptional regulator NrdR family protein
MGQVIKRGGGRQKFMPEKIRKSIRKAATAGRISQAKTRDLVNDVGNSVIDLFQKKKLVKTIDLRKSILGRINRRVKSVGSAWKKSEKKKTK